MIEFEWEGLVRSLSSKWAGSMAELGVSYEELLALGRLAAIEAEGSWDPSGGRFLSSWVWILIEYRFKGHARNYRGARWAPYQDSDHLVEDHWSVVVAREALSLLRARLPEREWADLWLFYVEGRSCREIGALSGRSEGAVQKKMSVARKRSVRILEI